MRGLNVNVEEGSLEFESPSNRLKLISNFFFIGFDGFSSSLLPILSLRGNVHLAFFSAAACANLGKHKPNLVSMPANEATAILMPPMWSGCNEMSGL